MIWMTWRQHRLMLATFTLLFGAAASFYLIHGVILHHEYVAAGLARCVGVSGDPGCAARARDYLNTNVGTLQYLGPLLALGGGALGVFLGAPLVAAEFERGTHQWVWTQRVSRTRWLAAKYAMLTLVVLVLSAGLAAAYTWWGQPVAAITGPFRPFGSFDTTPLMFCVYALFGFAVGVAASSLIRRTVTAMGVTLALFVTVRIGITLGLRPHYMTPLTVASTPTGEGPLGFDSRDWDISSRWVDAAGHSVSQPEIRRLTDPALNPDAANTTWDAFLRQHGIHYVDLVQPYQRAPTFQLIEASIYLTLITVCAAVAFWRIRRRAI